MAQDRNLPEGTDKIVGGASQTGGTTGAAGRGEEIVVTETTIVAEMEVPAPEGTDLERSFEGSGSPAGASGSGSSASRGSGASSGAASAGGGIKDKLREGSQKLTGQAADKSRDFVNQGLERSSEALSNVSRLVGETASGLDERLGPEYGDYARRAAEAIDSTAQKLRSKDPDELIDDTRDFVRKSPAVALAGAAIVGFALARLVKTGLQAATGQQSGARSGDEGPRGARRGGEQGGAGDEGPGGGSY